MFSSYNYTLAYFSDNSDPEPIVWSHDFRPDIPGFCSEPRQYPTYVPFKPGDCSWSFPKVNIRGSYDVLNNITSCWEDIPELVEIVGQIDDPDIPFRCINSSGIQELVHNLQREIEDSSRYAHKVNWDMLNSVFNAEWHPWVPRLAYASRHIPESITLAPIMHQEIIDTICNLYHFTNWVLTACKIDPVRFKSENFVLLRIN